MNTERREVTIQFNLLGHNRGMVRFSNEKDANSFLRKIDSELVDYQIAKGWFDYGDFPKGARSYKGPMADFYE